MKIKLFVAFIVFFLVMNTCFSEVSVSGVVHVYTPGETIDYTQEVETVTDIERIPSITFDSALITKGIVESGDPLIINYSFSNKLDNSYNLTLIINVLHDRQIIAFAEKEIKLPPNNRYAGADIVKEMQCIDSKGEYHVLFDVYRENMLLFTKSTVVNMSTCKSAQATILGDREFYPSDSANLTVIITNKGNIPVNSTVEIIFESTDLNYTVPIDLSYKEKEEIPVQLDLTNVSYGAHTLTANIYGQNNNILDSKNYDLMVLPPVIAGAFEMGVHYVIVTALLIAIAIILTKNIFRRV